MGKSPRCSRNGQELASSAAGSSTLVVSMKDLEGQFNERDRGWWAGCRFLGSGVAETVGLQGFVVRFAVWTGPGCPEESGGRAGKRAEKRDGAWRAGEDWYVDGGEVSQTKLSRPRICRSGAGV
jgi:hypothetical protein